MDFQLMAVLETFFFSFSSFVKWVPKTAKFHHTSLKGRSCSAKLRISHCTDTANRETQAQKFPKWFSMDPAWHSGKQQMWAKKKAQRTLLFRKLRGKGSLWNAESSPCFLSPGFLVPAPVLLFNTVWPRAGHLILMKFISKFCYFMDYTVHGILQARILEWVAFPFSRGSSEPRNWTQVSCIAGGFFNSWATREAQEYWSG